MTALILVAVPGTAIIAPAVCSGPVGSAPDGGGRAPRPGPEADR